MSCLFMWIAVSALVIRYHVGESMPALGHILCLGISCMCYTIAFVSECSLRERVKKMEERDD